MTYIITGWLVLSAVSGVVVYLLAHNAPVIDEHDESPNLRTGLSVQFHRNRVRYRCGDLCSRSVHHNTHHAGTHHRRGTGRNRILRNPYVTNV